MLFFHVPGEHPGAVIMASKRSRQQRNVYSPGNFAASGSTRKRNSRVRKLSQNKRSKPSLDEALAVIKASSRFKVIDLTNQSDSPKPLESPKKPESPSRVKNQKEELNLEDVKGSLSCKDLGILYVDGRVTVEDLDFKRDGICVIDSVSFHGIDVGQFHNVPSIEAPDSKGQSSHVQKDVLYASLCL